MKAITLQTNAARYGVRWAFRQLVFLFIVAMAFNATDSRATTTASCQDCGIYESLCEGKAVHWYVLDDEGWYVKGDPKKLLRSPQARGFINDVRKKFPGKFHSKEICHDHPLA